MHFMHALRAGLDELLCFAWLARSVETRMLSEVFGLGVGCRICLLCHMYVHLSGTLVGLLFSLVGVRDLEDETERLGERVRRG